MSVPVDVAWWHSVAAYQIYVRSFADANGDGIGDLDGIIAKLDYLQWLGIGAIWLNPCYPSPQRDHGYDVSDYLDIHHEYGDLATFDRLVKEANARSIRVLMDIVPNHTSDQHAWFRKAVEDGPGSEARDWYYFRDGRGVNGTEPPNNWRAWFGGSAWTRIVEPDGSPGQWFLHLFTPQQPDLNWKHEPVGVAFDEILRFWWDRGVEGFRIDAPAPVGKAPGLPDAPPLPPGTPDVDVARLNPHVVHRPEVHDLFRRWRSVAEQYQHQHPNRRIAYFGETYGPSFELVSSYVNDQELHTTFDFSLLLANWEPHRWRSALAQSARRPDVALTWTLNNHDAQRSVSRYGHLDAHLPSSFTDNNLLNSKEPVDLTLGAERARAAMWLLAFLPQPIFLYAGEELGLPEVLDLPESSLQDPIFFNTGGAERGRDGCRVPIPWTDDETTHYGFSLMEPNAPAWLPQPATYGALAASLQASDPESMLSSYRDVLALRATLAADAAEAQRLHLIEGEAIPDAVVAMRRGEYQCWLNFGMAPVRLPDNAKVIGTSRPASQPGGSILAPNTAVWLAPH